MKVLVTGANGYLGQGIVKSILDLGNDVVAADFKVENIDSRANRVECDLFDIQNPYLYFGQPDVLLHLAWEMDLYIIRQHILMIYQNIIIL